MEFIPGAGACLATRNVIEKKGLVRWMVRGESKAPADNGTANWQIVDFHDLCTLEPALSGIWDLPVGSDLQIVRDELGIRIVDTPTGREIPVENLYVPPSQRAE